MGTKFVLNAGNFNEWRRNVLIALDLKGLRDYLNMESPPTDATLYPNGATNFAKARGLILEGLDYAAISLVDEDASPKAIMKKFEENFLIPNIVSQGLIIRKMCSLKGRIGHMDI